MRVLLAAVLCTACYAQTPVFISSVDYNNKCGPPSGGDTEWYGAYSKADATYCPGGGCRFGTFNDGYFNCSVDHASYNVNVTKLNSYTPGSIAGTLITTANTMSSFGLVNGLCYDNATTAKSQGIWFINNLLYMQSDCLEFNNFHVRSAGITVSADYGATWKNYKTWLASGSAKAGGDFPVDSAGYQWPTGAFDSSPKTFAYLRPITRNCQDNTVNCPPLPGLDPAYMYFITGDGEVTGGMQAVRAPINDGGVNGHMMAPAVWGVWNGTVWAVGASPATLPGTDVTTGPYTHAFACCVGVHWSEYFSKFITLRLDNASAIMATASSLTGTWTVTTGISNPAILGWANILPGSEHINSSGHVQVTIAGGGPDAHSVQFQEWDFGPPPTAGARSSLGANVVTTGKVVVK